MNTNFPPRMKEGLAPKFSWTMGHSESESAWIEGVNKIIHAISKAFIAGFFLVLGR